MESNYNSVIMFVLSWKNHSTLVFEKFNGKFDHILKWSYWKCRICKVFPDYIISVKNYIHKLNSCWPWFSHTCIRWSVKCVYWKCPTHYIQLGCPWKKWLTICRHTLFVQLYSHLSLLPINEGHGFFVVKWASRICRSPERKKF